MKPNKDNKNQSVQSITRAASILRLLGKETAGLSLGQIARHVELPRSTVQRIVSTLSDEGFIATGNGASGIRLGPEIQSLASAIAIDPRDRLKPIMQQVASQTGETVDLAVLRDGHMLFLDQIVGSQRLRTVSSIGERFPLTSTANGKAALACLDEMTATNLALEELRAAGPSARRLAPLLAEIDDIRNGALARDENEHTDGISALGFGIADADGEVFALSVPVPSTRFTRTESQLVVALTAAKQALA